MLKVTRTHSPSKTCLQCANTPRETKSATVFWKKSRRMKINKLEIAGHEASGKGFGQFRSDQSLSRIQLFATPWIAAHQASLSITNSRSSLRLTSIELVMPSSHLILCHPLLLLPPVPPSIRVFSNESTLCMRWPKYWSFNISPSNEHPGLITFRMDWLDLLAVQGTLETLLQHHNSKESILWYSVLFYGPTLTPMYNYWKNHMFDYRDLCRPCDI